MAMLALFLAEPALAFPASVPTRPGVTVDLLVDAPKDATALVVLFEGASGLLSLTPKGFAHEAYRILPSKGIGAVLIDAPTDGSGFKGGMDPLFRESAAHIADVDAVIAALKLDYKLPVWVLGWSTGSRSAAAYAMQRSANIDGVVLVSSSTSPPFGDPIYALPLEAVTVPLLAIAHEDDGCQGTPPAGATKIARAATASSTAVALVFSGGTNTGSWPCGVETHHAMFGIEAEVVSAIAAFIRAQPPAGATHASDLR